MHVALWLSLIAIAIAITSSVVGKRLDCALLLLNRRFQIVDFLRRPAFSGLQVVSRDQGWVENRAPLPPAPP